MKIIEYDVIQDTSLKDLKKYINYLIKQGWEPLGSLIIEEDIYYQCMVKRDI